MCSMVLHDFAYAWPGVGWLIGAAALVVTLAIKIGFLIGLFMVGRWLWRETAGRTRPLDALRLRYARGELSRQEFEALKRDLQQAG